MATDIDELKAWLRTYPDGPLSPASIYLRGIEALQRELAEARGLPSIAYMTAREDSAKEIAGLKAENAALRKSLTVIYEWMEFPRTGRYWDTEKTREMSYSAAFGSNGERDYMRQLAHETLRKVREREAKK